MVARHRLFRLIINWKDRRGRGRGGMEGLEEAGG